MKIKKGEIYFLRERHLLSGLVNPYIKIGLVAWPKTARLRVNELQTGNPREIEVICSVETEMVTELETFLHKLYAERRFRGEWFELDPEETDRLVKRARSTSSTLDKSLDFARKVEELKDHPSNGSLRAPSESESIRHAEVCKLDKKLKLLNAQKTLVTKKLQAMAAGTMGIEGVLTTLKRNYAPRLDADVFQADYPDLAAQYIICKETVRGSFSISGTLSLKQIDPDLYLEIQAIEFENPSTLEQVFQDRNEEAMDLHKEHLRLLAEIAPIILRRQRYELDLKAACGKHDGIDGICLWRRNHKKNNSLDKKRLKEEHPGLYEQFLQDVKSTYATKVLDYRSYNCHE